MKSTHLIGLLSLALLNLIVLPLSAQESTNPKDAQGCFCIGMRGNVNCDFNDEVTISDLSFLIDHLFISGISLPNPEEANADADPDGNISISDLGRLIDYLYISLDDLPLCPVPSNTPPITIIESSPSIGRPVINSVVPAFNGTGVRVRWSASDIVDHPHDEPAFEYEWRLYGPYPDSIYEEVSDRFVYDVFRHIDGTVYRKNADPAESFIVCDTSWDGGIRTITCETIMVDTIADSNQYGTLDVLFDVVDPEFISNPNFNRVVEHSRDFPDPLDPWVADTRDSVYNIFAVAPSDTTIQMKFVFWIRAREPLEPEVVDPVPAFVSFDAIDPKFERPVLIINMTLNSQNQCLPDTLQNYWNGALNEWLSGRPDIGSTFDAERDFVRAASVQQSSTLLKLLLSYKSIILVHDVEKSGIWSFQQTNLPQSVQSAMSVGVNVWVCGRVQLGSFVFGSAGATVAADDNYRFYYGVDEYTFSGWGYWYLFQGQTRIEDFVGATSADISLWPDLEIDSSLLHTRYRWSLGWIDSLAAMPEVGWFQPGDGEVIYRYRSLYGANHPLGAELSFHDRPVAVRLNRGVYRTASSLFTPVALKQPAGQQFVNRLMDWLIEPYYPPGKSGESPPEVNIGSLDLVGEKGGK